MYIIPLSKTIMIGWDCLKYGKLYFSEKCYLKGLTEINYSTKKSRPSDYAPQF